MESRPRKKPLDRAYLTGAALRAEIDRDYAYLKSTLLELGLAK